MPDFPFDTRCIYLHKGVFTWRRGNKKGIGGTKATAAGATARRDDQNPYPDNRFTPKIDDATAFLLTAQSPDDATEALNRREQNVALLDDSLVARVLRVRAVRLDDAVHAVDRAVEPPSGDEATQVPALPVSEWEIRKGEM